MQFKNTCKRCKYLSEAKGYDKFNHFCNLSGEIIPDDKITKHTCLNFENINPRAAFSIFKYVLGADGKYYRYYLSDEEAFALFERRQKSRSTSCANELSEPTSPTSTTGVTKRYQTSRWERLSTPLTNAFYPPCRVPPKQK